MMCNFGAGVTKQKSLARQMGYMPLAERAKRLSDLCDKAKGAKVSVNVDDLRALLRNIDTRQATPLENGVVVIDEVRADRFVRAINDLLPADLMDDHVYDFGFEITARPETIEALKRSDNTFAGRVISYLSGPDGRNQYEDWIDQSSTRAWAAEMAATKRAVKSET
jgi:hypothetical protein